METELVVGCPVSNRAWILPKWFEHVDVACAMAGLRPTFAFVGAPLADPDTFKVVRQWIAQGNRILILDSGEATRNEDRVWGPERYAHMVWLRNRLLLGVRHLAPRFFLSVDSDILLHPETLKNLIESSEQFGAVGGRAYMTPLGVHWPSYGMWKSDGGVRRSGDAAGVFKVDVIMALKLMGPEAYAVDYEAHEYGEDAGWSRACREAGVSLGWDGRCVSKHILDRPMLTKPDLRVGW